MITKYRFSIQQAMRLSTKNSTEDLKKKWPMREQAIAHALIWLRRYKIKYIYIIIIKANKNMLSLFLLQIDEKKEEKKDDVKPEDEPKAMSMWDEWSDDSRLAKVLEEKNLAVSLAEEDPSEMPQEEDK